jgi:flagellar basal body rod protein FlgG
MLATLQNAFDATWVEIQTNEPLRDFTKDGELRTRLSKKLVTLAGEGVTDAAQLRRLALKSLPLKLKAKRNQI